MPTVVNDLIVEPKAAPPAAEARPAGGGSGGGGGTEPPPPEFVRQVQHAERLCHERSLRLWAH